MPRRHVALGLAVAVVAALALGGLGYLVFSDQRRHHDLTAMLDPALGHDRLIAAGRDATTELCGPEHPCEQAVVSPGVTAVRYATTDEARVAVAQWGADGARSCWIAFRFAPGGLTDRQRSDLVQMFTESNVSSEDGVPPGRLDC